MLILVRGLPGSGKSTFAKRMFPQIVHLENDMFHMVYDRKIFPKFKYDFKNELSWERSKTCRLLVEELLENGVSVVVSNVFANKNSISQYIDIAQARGKMFKVFRMENDFGNQHNVPEDALNWMKTNFVDYVGEYLVKSYSQYFEIKDPEGTIIQYSC